MKIGIIGAGFTGLSSAYYLSKKGHDVTVFEKDSNPGGLAIGFKDHKWQWSLEKHYHHFFTNDKSALKFLKEIDHPIIIKRPKTSIYIKNNFYQLDSPIHLLKLNALTISERFRMGLVLGFLRYYPFWQQLEGIRADSFLNKTMGENAYEKIWKPQLYNKFGKYAKDISLAWFWARIKKRTPGLAYPEGGFVSFAQKIKLEAEKSGAKFIFNSKISDLQKLDFDKVLVTIPTAEFLKIAKLPKNYVKRLNSIQHLSALVLVLTLKEPFFTENTYWLNITDKSFPFLVMAEHTNFMDKKNYGNQHILYIGNYLPDNHPYLKLSAKELLKIYDPYLKKINPNHQPLIINHQSFSFPNAQPIVTSDYQKIMPEFITPLKNVYLANMDMVYPWDRGVNYAIELGEKVAKIVSHEDS